MIIAELRDRGDGNPRASKNVRKLSVNYPGANVDESNKTNEEMFRDGRENRSNKTRVVFVVQENQATW